MREILFRGKRKTDKRWVYGGVINQKDFYGDAVDDWFILNGDDTLDNDIGEPFYVDPDTVGQFTGLCDKEGKKIFEGDIITGTFNFDGEQGEFRAAVKWEDGSWVFEENGYTADILTHEEAESYSVIGNIHDNPEIMEGENG